MVPEHDKGSLRVEVARRTRNEAVVDFLTFGAVVAFLYFSYNPDAYDHIKGFARSWWQKLQLQASVWDVQREIQSLPVTDVTDVTGN